MKGEKNWTRFAYERSYRQLRRDCDFDTISENTNIEIEIVQAADYSYQASLYTVHGWSNDRRRIRFHQIKWRILTGSEEMSF